MRLSLIVSFSLLLPALPAAADGERLRPETAAPPVIVPAPDAVCREQARRLDERTRQTADVAAAAGGAAAFRISEDMGLTGGGLCGTASGPAPARPQSSDGTVTGSYERLLRLCGQPEGQR